MTYHIFDINAFFINLLKMTRWNINRYY